MKFRKVERALDLSRKSVKDTDLRTDKIEEDAQLSNTDLRILSLAYIGFIN